MSEIFCSMHRMHCSSACLLKLHCENGQLKRITSAGDIPRADGLAEDERLFPPQRRACPRGYAELDHIYSPYRVTKPLLQTGTRGCRSTFREISWEEAVKRAAEFYHRMLLRAEKLGYLPVIEKNGVGTYLGRVMSVFGNSSSGCADAAIHAALGSKELVKGHPPIDMFNADYCILWGCNPAETLPYLSYWLVRLKERGIPVTVVDSRFTDSAAAYTDTGLGTPDGLPAAGRIPGCEELPPAFVNPRPGTDGALLAAMAVVIRKHGLCDETFLRDYCFGFEPGDTVVSASCGQDPVTGEPYAGKSYRVPPGQSFTEYLDSLEAKCGGCQGVLAWCEAETGVPAETAERLAICYGKADRAFLFSRYHGGPQRSLNGMYYCWMLIALSAMTGNIIKRGGGFGELRGMDAARYLYPEEPDVILDTPYQPILISKFSADRLILTGRDDRTPEQLRSDVLRMNGLDLGADPRLRVCGVVKGLKNGNSFNQVPGINLRRIAWERLDFVMTYEREFSPMAAMCDLVLPSVGQYEGQDYLFQHQFGGSDTYLVRGVLPAPGEALTDREIHRRIAAELGLRVRPEEEYADISRRMWEQAKVPESTLRHHPEYCKPSYEKLLEQGIEQLPEFPEDTEPDASRFAPGKWPTETGKINFYAPFVAERGRSVHGITRAAYVPMPQGSRDYPLQLISPHTIVKADATYDNVQILDELRPKTISMHPDDAGQRGLKEGQTAWLYSEWGCLKLPVHLTPSVRKGVVSVPHGAWYIPDESDRFTAWFDADGDGIAEAHDTAVDKGGNTNTVTPEECAGLLDPFFSGHGLNSNGYYVQVEDHNPGCCSGISRDGELHAVL